ncbi:MAG: hypothetical protein J07HX64_00087 [halophilic archaeon J07HX64]|nr:MAG: hypothetical protein J07HX64_00087 [halophilic archaeon J07HX64]
MYEPSVGVRCVLTSWSWSPRTKLTLLDSGYATVDIVRDTMEMDGLGVGFENGVRYTLQFWMHRVQLQDSADNE